MSAILIIKYVLQVMLALSLIYLFAATTAATKTSVDAARVQERYNSDYDGISSDNVRIMMQALTAVGVIATVITLVIVTLEGFVSNLVMAVLSALGVAVAIYGVVVAFRINSGKVTAFAPLVHSVIMTSLQVSYVVFIGLRQKINH